MRSVVVLTLKCNFIVNNKGKTFMSILIAEYLDSGCNVYPLCCLRSSGNQYFLVLEDLLFLSAAFQKSIKGEE